MAYRIHKWGTAPGTPDDAYHNVTRDNWYSSTVLLPFGYSGEILVECEYATFLRAPMSLLAEVTLNSAYITATAAETSTGPAYDMEIFGVDATNCPALDSDQSALPLIQDSPPLLWPCGTWTQDSTYDTPDLTGLLRAYLDRGDYDPAAGYYWGLVFKSPAGHGVTAADRVRAMVSNDHADAATKAAQFVAQYTLPEANVQVEETLAICQTFTKDLAIAQEIAETVGSAQETTATLGIAKETNETLGICQQVTGALVR